MNPEVSVTKEVAANPAKLNKDGSVRKSNDGKVKTLYMVVLKDREGKEYPYPVRAFTEKAAKDEAKLSHLAFIGVKVGSCAGIAGDD